MSPSPRAVVLAVALALALLVVPWPLVLVAAVAALAATTVDAVAARAPLRVRRTVPARLARGVPAGLSVLVEGAGARRVRVRQPRLPDLWCEPAEGDGGLDAEVVAHRRGHHLLPPVVARATGPLGLARWDHRVTGPAEVDVDPDLPAARRLASAVRQARFRDPGLRRRGAVGLGTDFDRLRDYQPDDDVRHVNWVATARRGRPTTNVYREDTERDVVALVDLGRLMAAPVRPPGAADAVTRLDVAIDAAAALAAVADAVGDRCGTVAFDDEVRARVRPRRASGAAVVRALHALEPRPVDSDPEVAFRAVGTTKRALVVVLTDLVDPAAAAALLDAVPVLVRRHAVVVASCTDADLEADVAPDADGTAPDPDAARRRVVATRVLDARDRARAEITRRGATVVEARPERFSAAVVAAYLDAKAAARL
ncbi:DUF58 domain-containing protein [Iamia majanohamensis]|uniref:DUF58 domain-containing protein n=1 Tax=Iamia majanohamensis TaxID=467976 RepID=A0AAE9Y8A1_9ACTN|nr:DUF58 domain-containing protein [Iamia majanohamensis]WCO68580.1 DUF58 domain-containing protein [Iamia majanohamensis]